MREHPNGYQNIQFCHHFHRWWQSSEMAMHIDHRAGERLFVDYAGDRLELKMLEDRHGPASMLMVPQLPV